MQNKHIIRFSFLVIFLSLIANIIVYRQFILSDIILREISSNNKHLIQIYQEQIWSSSSKVIKKLRISPSEKARIPSELISFVKRTLDFFTNPAFLKVQIFDKNSNEFFVSNDLVINVVSKDTTSFYEYYSTKLDYQILEDLVIYDGLSKAYNADPVSGVFPKVTITSPTDHIKMGSKNATKTSSVIVNYIPIIDDLGEVEAVIVIYTDATLLRSHLNSLERKIFAALIVLFCLFFAIIIRNTNYAQKVIDKHIQLNKLLEAAKIQAEDENRSKTEFLANVSHELRTPLNTIIGFSEIILSEHSANIDPKKHNDYVGDILQSGKHLLSVINDILDYSKASADKLKVEMIEVDINKIAKSSIRFVEPRAKEANIKLITEIPEALIIIKADPKRLRQALLNLLSNAVKFTHDGGSVTINIVKNIEKKQIYIRIIDTGIGIAENDIPKALASFGQVDNSLSRKYEGTGLGLPLTKKLIELMNGKFEISSAVGVGTTITLTFDQALCANYRK